MNHRTDAEKLTAIRQIAEDAAGVAGMDNQWPPAWAEEVLAVLDGTVCGECGAYPRARQMGALEHYRGCSRRRSQGRDSGDHRTGW